MLQLLSPLALVGLAALALPAILHLWRPPARTVRVGTIRFFTGPAVRRLTKLRWRERLLLALRLLLLALLGLLLARPFWKTAPPNTPQRWALLAPDVVLNDSATRRWQELKREGFQTRLLAADFPPAPSASSRGAPSRAVDMWSLLREADARLPAGSKLAVFSADRVVSLRGERPAMQHCEVEWIPTPNEPDEQTWIRSAQLLDVQEPAAKQVRVVVSVSNARQTSNVVAVVRAAPGNTPLPQPLDRWSLELLESDDKSLSARLRPPDKAAVPGASLPIAKSKALNVAVLPGADRTDDARYVEAAVQAVAKTSGRRTNITDDVATADWVFWLNDDQPPSELVQALMLRGAALLSDASNTSAHAVPVATTITGQANGEPVRLLRRTPADDDGGASVWADSFGAPLLTLAPEGRGERWRFHSRFHPEWNDLPRSSALAAALRPLLAGSDEWPRSPNEYDERRADASQSRPAEASRVEGGGLELGGSPELINLHQLVWLLCIGLFVAERVLSHRQASATQDRAAATARPLEPELAGRA